MVRLTFLALLIGCSGSSDDKLADPIEDTGTAEETDPSPTETGTPSTTDTETTPTDTETTPTGNVMLGCRDLDYQSTCRGENSGYDVCSDYFGGYTDPLVEPTCSISGEFSKDPCTEYPHPVGACIFDAAGTDLCYTQHIGAPTAADVADAVAFWETTCPAVGGTWVP